MKLKQIAEKTGLVILGSAILAGRAIKKAADKATPVVKDTVEKAAEAGRECADLAVKTWRETASGECPSLGTVSVPKKDSNTE